MARYHHTSMYMFV